MILFLLTFQIKIKIKSVNVLNCDVKYMVHLNYGNYNEFKFSNGEKYV